MTDKESIEILEHWLEHIEHGKDGEQLGYIERWVYDKDVEAFKHAIEVLKYHYCAMHILCGEEV